MCPGAGIVWVNFNGFAIVCEGISHVSPCGPGGSSIEISVRKMGVQFDCAIEVGDGAVNVSPGKARRAPVRVNAGDLWGKVYSLAVIGNSPIDVMLQIACQPTIVPGVRDAGVDFQRASEIAQCAIEIALLPSSKAAVIPRFQTGRIDPGRFRSVGYRSIETAAQRPHRRSINKRVIVVAVERNSPVEVDQRCVDVALISPRDAAVGICFGRLRIESQRLIAVGDGPVQVAEEVLGCGAVAVCSRVVWLKLDCAGQIADTSGEIPLCKSRKASIEPSGGQVFIERNRETKIGNGPIQIFLCDPLVTALDIRYRRSRGILPAAQVY